MAEPERTDGLEEDPDLKDKLMRAQAELANMAQRYNRQVKEARTEGEAQAVLAFLPLLDDVKRAIQAMGQPGVKKRSLREGIELIGQKLGTILEQLSIEEIESVGRPFTSDVMEAVALVPATEETPEGTVAAQLAAGYRRRGLLLRPALVTVAMGKGRVPGDGE